MNKFFDYSVNTSFEAGFGRFSVGHMLCLLAAAVLFITSFLLGRSKPALSRTMARVAAYTALGLELGRAALMLSLGVYGRGSLPLHLCTLSVYLCSIYALRPGPLLGQFLYAFTMPGAAFALVFPDWADYPLLHFVSLSSFGLHILLVLCPLLFLACGDIRRDIRLLPGSIVLMLILAVPVLAVNRLLGTNYMFLSWPPSGTPLDLFAHLGRPGYWLGFVPPILGVWLLLYCSQLLPLQKKFRKSSLSKEKTGTKERQNPS